MDPAEIAAVPQHSQCMSCFWSMDDEAWIEAAQWHIQSQEPLADDPLVPPLIHMVWLGGAVPPALARVARSWQTLHPDWQCVLWDDEAVAKLPLLNAAAFASAPNRGFQADILRYELLYRYGGWYVDMDLLCTRPLHALSRAGALVTAQSNSTVWELNNAFIGAVPGHPCLAAIMLGIRSPGVAAAVAAPGLADAAGSEPGSGGAYGVGHPYGSVADGQPPGTAVSTSPEATLATTGPGLFTRMLGTFMAAAVQSQGSELRPGTPHPLHAAVLAAAPACLAACPALPAATAAALPPQALPDGLCEDWSAYVAVEWPDLRIGHGGAAGAGSCVPVVLPAVVAYPLPNTLPLAPPALFKAGHATELEDVLAQLHDRGVTELGDLAPGLPLMATLARLQPLPKALREAVVGKQHAYRLDVPGVHAVHWWAKAWTRPAAQLAGGAAEHGALGGADAPPKGTPEPQSDEAAK